MALGSADLAVMLADLAAAGGGVSVTLGATTVTGLMDREAMQVLEGDMPGGIADERAVHVETGALTGLTSGSAITVDGTAYVVREALPYGDGAMTRIALRTP